MAGGLSRHVRTCYVAPSLLFNWGGGGNVNVNVGHLYFLAFYSRRFVSLFLYAVKFFACYLNYYVLRNLEEKDHLRDIGAHRGDTIKMDFNYWAFYIYKVSASQRKRFSLQRPQWVRDI
jgi:hypothetical protein